MATITSNHVRRKHKPVSTKPKRMHPNIRKIFKDLFKVSMMQKDIRSIEEQRVFGNTSTGDKKLDEMLANSYVTIYLTINDMIEYYREGITFRLTDASDSKVIYEVISEHTARWRDALQHAFNMGKSPVEDLITMEQFIATIYERAKFEYIDKSDPRENAIKANSSLYDFLYGKGGFSSTSYLADGSLRKATSINNSDEIIKTKHNPNTEVFKKALISKMELNENARRTER